MNPDFNHHMFSRFPEDDRRSRSPPESETGFHLFHASGERRRLCGYFSG